MDILQRFPEVPDKADDALRIQTIAFDFDYHLDTQNIVPVMIDIFRHGNTLHDRRCEVNLHNPFDNI